MTELARIRVATAAPYDVVVGRDLSGELLDAVPAGTAAIVHQPTVAAAAQALCATL